MEHEVRDTTNFIVKWKPPKREWEPEPEKPFLIQVLKKGIFNELVDREFIVYFKNSLSIMCEVWLKRKGIDPTINTSKNFHKLQDEFLKVLAHINRGFELEVNADWKKGVGKLMEIWKRIEKEANAQWIDHQEERRKGDPASRYELKEEPKQDLADAFWVSLFKKGLKWKETMLGIAQKIDTQQSRFFFASFDIDEQKTFTETKINLLNIPQEAWLQNTLSGKLGLRRRYDFLEETFGSSLEKVKDAHNIITEGNAKLWLINYFFQLHKRDWLYLLGTLTGGHVALERLFGCLIATLLIGRDRKAFELKEDEAEEFFTVFWQNDLTLPFEKAENVLRGLHQSIINTEEYKIYREAAMLLHALQASDTYGKSYKTCYEAEPVLQTLCTPVKKIISYPIHDGEHDYADLQFPINSEKRYVQLLSKLELLLKLEMEVHKVVEDIFWNVIETFSDLVRAYKIQTKKELSGTAQETLKAIAHKHHLRPEENNFLMYASDRCYIGKELRYFRGSEKKGDEKTIELYFETRTQKIKKNYITPPLRIRRELIRICGRYGKLIGDIRDKKTKETFPGLKMVWNPPKIQLTDLRYRSAIHPLTPYEIKITSAEPRKPREKWE